MSQAQKEMYKEQELKLIESMLNEMDENAKPREVIDHIYKTVEPCFVFYVEIEEMFWQFVENKS
jgi:hypothetical protein|tara:strand:+ start:222 stop:413 length:192 start_codon:yes stop_codon:yes gene_type:complete